MAQLAYHLSLSVPGRKVRESLNVDAFKVSAERTRYTTQPGTIDDYRSLQILAAHTVPPGSEVLFAQSLRNLWAVKAGQ